MKKEDLIKSLGIIIIIILFLWAFKLLWNNQALMSGTNYEEITTKFIAENDAAFSEDGYELKLISQEKIDDKTIKMTFFYKLYSYPEEGQFRADVLVNTENGSVNFVKK
jgi:hypothetical protein